MLVRNRFATAIALALLASSLFAGDAHNVATFSIVARDPAAGEIGVAVASRFFSVGSVVPWAKGDVGAVATQAGANVSFGPRGLELMERGASAEEVVAILLHNDPEAKKRQIGVVAADGSSASYTGPECQTWAGGRHGPNYAVQGNILAGEAVVVALEKAFLETKGTLADRMYAALLAGDAQGGDSRGRQSAVLIVVKPGAGFQATSDRAIDIRVDDSKDPFGELGRLLKIAQMNYSWNAGWTLFTQKKFAEALVAQERAAGLAPENPELLYDLGVIRLAAGKRDAALEALEKALRLNPKLIKQATNDHDLDALRGDARFAKLIAAPK
ncbi:MAG TPA: DUF1028 domain-containing protein [Thermoanaerobaculia bacterium]|nr:DUF1028 domain-containing protein [Thermoanaerobaculia bacterium]